MLASRQIIGFAKAEAIARLSVSDQNPNHPPDDYLRVMEPSATKRFVSLLNDHAARMMQAAQDDSQAFIDRSYLGEPPPDYRETNVGRLDDILRPIDPSGPFFKAHAAAVKECAELGQLAAFQPLFERAKYSYWRAWDRARKAFTSDERLNWGTPEFGTLTRHIAEIQDYFSALEVEGRAAQMIERGSDGTGRSLEERRVADLHEQFLSAAKEFPEIRFVAVRPYDPVRDWPNIRDEAGDWHIGLTGRYWKALFADLGFSPGKLFAPLSTVWLRFDQEIWEGGFFNGGRTASSDEEALMADGRQRLKDGRPQSKLQAQFDHLQRGVEKFRQLSEHAKLHFQVPPEPPPGTQIERLLRDNHINRWLELVFRAGIWESVDQRILRVQRLTADVFTASARAIEILVRSSASILDGPSVVPSEDSEKEPPPKPHWDRGSKRLTFSGTTVKRYRHVAKNQFLVLDTFEELGWPTAIDDPIPPGRKKEVEAVARVQETAKSLNDNMDAASLIRFATNGSGNGFTWSLIK